ncbi:GvpL/GvpF family gas vesicle protein [Streptomyces hypolithicus]
MGGEGVRRPRPQLPGRPHPRPPRHPCRHAAAPPPAPRDRSRPAPGAGLAYLERKRGIQQRWERQHEDTLRIAEEVDAEVRALAADSRRLRPHGREVTGEGRTQVLNATYLVADQRARDLEILAQTLGRRTGAQIEISGPWVPYSFVGEV